MSITASNFLTSQSALLRDLLLHYVQVYKGIRAHKELVAVKLLHSVGPGSAEALEQSVERIFSLPRHRNIACLLGASLDERRPILVRGCPPRGF